MFLTRADVLITVKTSTTNNDTLYLLLTDINLFILEQKILGLYWCKTQAYLRKVNYSMS